MKKHQASAFSLIELSIVILVIGILVAGVTQSSRLISAMRLNTARALTQSSPISSITGLVLWLETTSESSFISSEADGSIADNVSTWYDINTQSSSKATFTNSSGGKPTYTDNAINSLPALSFESGESDYMVSSGNINAVGYTRTSTVFVVMKPSAVNGRSFYCFPQTSASTDTTRTIRFGIDPQASALGRLAIDAGANIYNYTANGVIVADSVSILSAVFLDVANGGTGANTVLYKNGANQPISAVANGGWVGGNAGTNNFVDDKVYVGADYNNAGGVQHHFSGMIGEVVVFNRSLKTEERQSVEKYLGQKWGVKI